MRSRAIARVAIIVTVVVGLDQVAKALVRSGVSVGEENNVFPGIKIVHVKNTGVAFGALSGGGAIVLALTGAALVLLVSYFARNPARPLLWLPTGLLLGGAAGDLLDRIPAQALELGYDAVLLNTAIAKAADPVAMAKAFRGGVEAGRAAYQAGLMEARDFASPSTPVVGTPFWHAVS